jgi:hypothetical protein
MAFRRSVEYQLANEAEEKDELSNAYLVMICFLIYMKEVNQNGDVEGVRIWQV